MDYGNYELFGAGIGELLKRCLLEMANATTGFEKHDFEWNPTDEELSNWATFIFAQWIIGKVEESTGMSVDCEKNTAVKRYMKCRAPEIVAYMHELKKNDGRS